MAVEASQALATHLSENFWCNDCRGFFTIGILPGCTINPRRCLGWPWRLRRRSLPICPKTSGATIAAASLQSASSLDAQSTRADASDGRGGFAGARYPSVRKLLVQRLPRLLYNRHPLCLWYAP